MKQFDVSQLKKVYIPPASSHKGQNGKLMIIGGSHLFHAASLWALEIASKIVDMVFYSSVPENVVIVQKEKQAFRNGIIVWREHIDGYIDEADCVLIGPGMIRNEKLKMQNEKLQLTMKNLHEINNLEDEGEQTYYLTKYLLEKYPNKKWIIDAGALQMMEPSWLYQLKGNCVLTPHKVEFQQLFQLEATPEYIASMAKKYNCIILVKGEQDIVCSPQTCIIVKGGNAGMTKGGTGDVLAGLIAALACTNDLFLAATAGSYINKKAGESLYNKVGYYFNASDLVQEIPRVMKKLLL